MTALVYLQALAFVLLTSFLLWHVFVPCRNEQAVIGGSLARLRESFPAAHVWVVDDASEDATSRVVAAIAIEDPQVHLVRRVLPDAQTGKGDALNAAYRALIAWLPEGSDHSRVIVAVVDADGVLAPDAMAYAAGPGAFADPTVGAAQCQVRMFAPPAGIGPFGRLLRDLQDAEFATTIAAMQILRGRTLSVGLGGNGQFSRVSALDAIGEHAGDPWHGSLFEDYELSLHLMLAGYQTRYLHEAVVSQEAVFTLPALVRQRTRWCQGGMQCTRYLKDAALSPHITPAGALEMAYFLSTPFQELLGLIVWPVVLGGALHLGLQSSPDLVTYLADASWVLPLTLLTGILPFASWGFVYARQRGMGLLRVLAYGLLYWLYSYLPQVYVISATARLLRGRNGWEKTARHADPAPATSAATVPSRAAGTVPSRAAATVPSRAAATHSPASPGADRRASAGRPRPDRAVADHAVSPSGELTNAGGSR